MPSNVLGPNFLELVYNHVALGIVLHDNTSVQERSLNCCRSEMFRCCFNRSLHFEQDDPYCVVRDGDLDAFDMKGPVFMSPAISE